MYAFDLKYAFLTTYNQTVFLKQELVRGKWRLYFSDPISSKTGVSTKSSEGFPGVTLRQCMLWLCSTTGEGPGTYVANNDTPINDWLNTDNVTESEIASPWRDVLRTGNVSLSPYVQGKGGAEAHKRNPNVRQAAASDPYNQDNTPSRGRNLFSLPSRPAYQSLDRQAQQYTPTSQSAQGYLPIIARSRTPSSQRPPDSQSSPSRGESKSRQASRPPPGQTSRESPDRGSAQRPPISGRQPRQASRPPPGQTSRESPDRGSAQRPPFSGRQPRPDGKKDKRRGFFGK